MQQTDPTDEKAAYLKTMGWVPSVDSDKWVKRSAGREWRIAGIDVACNDLEWLKRAVAEFAKQPLNP